MGGLRPAPPGPVIVVPATIDDADAIAALHAESWQSAYRGLLPDEFLDGPVVGNRLRHWRARMRAPDPDRRLVLKAVADRALVGFACVLLDEEPEAGALLDNLHVKPARKGGGIGWRLLQQSREWVGAVAPGERVHLWVIEGNLAARRFYDRQGGTIAERETIETLPGIYVKALRYTWAPWSPP